MKIVIKKNMKVRKQDKFLKIFSLILLFSWMILIFYLSNQKGSVSQSNSDSLILLLDKIFNKFNIDVELQSFSRISFFIRKLAHMFLYFILYFLTYFSMYQFKIKKKFKIALLVCFIFSVSDEIHQLFVPNRSGQVTDVLIDTMASFIAFLILKLISLRKSCKL